MWYSDLNTSHETKDRIMISVRRTKILQNAVVLC